jgi:hypothetical protein
VYDSSFDPKLQLLQQNITSLRKALFLAAVVLVCGLAMTGSNDHNYQLLTQTAPVWTWMLSLAVYAWLCVLPDRQYTPLSALALSVGGLWQWMYIFLTFNVYDTYPTSSAEFLVVLPVLFETWKIILQYILYKPLGGPQNASK